MAKKKMEKTKMRSNKWKKENENSHRFTRTSEIKPNPNGFRSTLLRSSSSSSSKRTSPRSMKTVLPHKEKSGHSKDAVKKKEKIEKLPMTPSSPQPSSHTNIDTTTSTTKKDKSSSTTNKDKSSSTTNKDKSSSTTNKDKSSSTTNKDKSSSTTNKDKSSLTTNKDKSSLTTNKDKSSSVSVNSPTSKNNKPVKKAYVVFVGNLPYDVTKGQLEEHFRKTGGVKIIRILKEKGTEIGRGFAYIEFKDRISHKIGLRLHHTHLNGRQINVEFTSIGGKNSRRLEKLKQKNIKLFKMKRDYPS